MLIRYSSMDADGQAQDGIVERLPLSIPCTSYQLFQQGISPRDITRLVMRGSLEAIGRAVYARDPDRLELAPCVAYLARQFPELHIGGTTALALHGLIPDELSSEKVQLWSSAVVRLPQWFVERFATSQRTSGSIPAELPDKTGIAADKVSGAPVSLPERALLEMLANVGTSQTIDDAVQIVQRLGLLNRKKLVSLVAACRNRKVLRLAYMLGSDARHEWAQIFNESACTNRVTG